MCGIAGVFEREGVRASRSLLGAMAGELRHRGPDGVGMYLDDRLGMVNTRLSIVDLSGGDQPIGSETGRFWVMQNGEIYNHPELRAELKAAGHVFTTQCDTEVLVHAYEQWGEDMLHRLIGAFAIAIWDREKSELFLARDRLGIRPLFVADCAGALLFASEAKALLRHEGMQRVIDPLALLEIFTLWGAAPERSAFEGVRELPPGTWLRVGADGTRTERCWWQLEFAERGSQRQESADALKEELLALLTDATRLRLRADVPVGAYLSGGLDSSAIAALVRRESTQELRSFAVRFADRRFDEREHQDRMAATLGTRLQAVEITGREVAEVFPEVIRLSEKPMFRTAPAPLLLLSKLARESGFKVVLTGEGADEMFAGYNIFKEAKIRRFWARQPKSQVRPLLLRRLYPYLGKDLGRTGGFLGAFFGRDLDRFEEPLFSHGIR
ncbi:MAG: asparagine synthase (glutamine-hydrolyzing), partial [Gemmatimonadaceae bacterium]|nr:asparagine synthase (glutamine-hydrolyzing) [Gemmatimonadaceae bacterium]